MPTRSCLVQVARYTCPRCNLRYCTLACYRAEAHGPCAEAFYKAALIEELHQTKAAPEERDRVLDMLQRLEAEADHGSGPNGDGDGDGDGEDEDDVATLADRLSEADLGAPPPPPLTLTGDRLLT